MRLQLRMSAESAVRRLALISMKTELGFVPITGEGGMFDPQSGASLLPPTMQLKGPSTGAMMICGEGLLSLPPDRIHKEGERLEMPGFRLSLLTFPQNQYDYLSLNMDF